jgi:hypothetical protein
VGTHGAQYIAPHSCQVKELSLSRKKGDTFFVFQNNESTSFMVSTIADFAQALQHLLTIQADDLAREVGFIRRTRKITGSSFAQSLVFGHLSQPRSSLEELTQTFIYRTETALVRQSLHERFTGRAAHFMERLVLAGLQIYCQGPAQSHAFFRQFSNVYVMDSTVITLPESVSSVWRGTQASGLKLHVRLNLTRGGFEQIGLSDGRVHDQNHDIVHDLGTVGSLHLADLGYFSLARLRGLSASGRFWLSRYKGGVRVRSAAGRPIDLLNELQRQTETVVDLPVQIGQTQALACRLIAIRVPDPVRAQRLTQLAEWERKHQRKASARRRALCA